jgi:post-segregation antitoxin (ccd killing protein)
MGRRKGIIRQRVDVTLHPDTIRRLRNFPNMSRTIDEAIEDFVKRKMSRLK